jgi:hypothetical protein
MVFANKGEYKWRMKMSDTKIRELKEEEITLVNGGTRIPGVLGGVILAAEIGWKTGLSINSFNRTVSRMSLGEALYYSLR